MQLPPNTDYVLQRMKDRGFSDAALERTQDQLLRGEQKVSVLDLAIVDGGLNIAEGAVAVGKRDLFFNGFKLTQIPEYVNYADKGIDTEKLVRDLIYPPMDSTDNMGYLQRITDQMKALQKEDEKLFHKIGGVLRPMLVGMDAKTNTKMMQADARIMTRSWFHHYDHLTIENASYLLMGRSVKVQPMPHAFDPEYGQRNVVSLPKVRAGETKGQGWITAPAWREIDWKTNINAGKMKSDSSTEPMEPRFKLLKFDEAYGFDPAVKLLDFDLPIHSRPVERDARIADLERGMAVTMDTMHPDHPTAVFMAHASKKTFHIYSSDSHDPLKHGLFRTAEAQSLWESRKSQYIQWQATQNERQPPNQQLPDGGQRPSGPSATNASVQESGSGQQPSSTTTPAPVEKPADNSLVPPLGKSQSVTDKRHEAPSAEHTKTVKQAKVGNTNTGVLKSNRVVRKDNRKKGGPPL